MHHLCPQITQITQIKTRTFCDAICVNLRHLRESSCALLLDWGSTDGMA